MSGGPGAWASASTLTVNYKTSSTPASLARSWGPTCMLFPTVSPGPGRLDLKLRTGSIDICGPTDPFDDTGLDKAEGGN